MALLFMRGMGLGPPVRGGPQASQAYQELSAAAFQAAQAGDVATVNALAPKIQAQAQADRLAYSAQQAQRTGVSPGAMVATAPGRSSILTAQIQAPFTAQLAASDGGASSAAATGGVTPAPAAPTILGLTYRQAALAAGGVALLGIIVVVVRRRSAAAG